MTTCKDCAHAVWQLTPTGRIKTKKCGQCAKAKDLASRYDKGTAAPCLIVTGACIAAIWPRYDATNCPEYKPK